MTKSAGGGYRSPIDLGIGRMPKTQNAENFAEMVEVYNALHVLNAYLDNIRGAIDVGIKDAPLEEQFPFKSGYWGTAYESINTGDVVHIDHESILVKVGLIVDGDDTGRAGYGLALNDAAEGEPVQVGVPPAVIRVDGAKPPDSIHSARFVDKTYKGKLLRGNLGDRKSARIGRCFAPNLVWLYAYGAKM